MTEEATRGQQLVEAVVATWLHPIDGEVRG